MNTDQILNIIQAHAESADKRAEDACKRSKYSIQDYHMCTEFAMQRLHDDIARAAGLERRCPIFPFRARLNEFRRATIEKSTLQDGTNLESEYDVSTHYSE